MRTRVEPAPYGSRPESHYTEPQYPPSRQYRRDHEGGGAGGLGGYKGRGKPTAMAGDSLHCIRSLMMIFSCIFAGVGLIFICLASLVAAGDLDMSAVIHADPTLRFILYAVLLGGGILFILGTLGGCGTSRGNRCMIVIFFVSISILFIAELSLGIWAFTSINVSNKDFDKVYRSPTSTEANRGTWDDVMRSHKCCAMETLQKDKLQETGLLEICCREMHNDQKVENRLEKIAECNDYQQGTEIEGCASRVVENKKYYVYGVGALVILVMMLQLLAVSVSICFFRGLRTA
ncbi:tetraspanin-18B-like [Festucalex cinctus]